MEEGGAGWRRKGPECPTRPAFWKISQEVCWLKGTGWREGAQKKKMEGGRELGLGFLISLGSRKIDRTMINANRIADVVTRRIYLLYPLAKSYYPS